MEPTIFGLPNRRWLFVLSGTKDATYRSDVFRGQSVAAFGAPEPVLESGPLALDAVAIAIRDDLARAIPRDVAAAIVRGYFDYWFDAVSNAEHHNQAVVFVAAELLGSGNNWRAGYGPTAKLPEYVASLANPRRLVVVYVNDILDQIRKRAAKAGLDLSGRSFAPPPDHPFLADCKAEWARWRAENVHVTRATKGPKIDKEWRQAIGGLLQ